MPTNEYSLKNEAVAMQKIGAEFEKLPEESQIRVIEWLSSVVHKKEKIQEVSDVKKFWQNKKPKNNYEKIAVLSYHFELVQQKGDFKLEDIMKLWDETREVLPGKQVICNTWKDVRSKYQYITSCPGTKKCRIAIRGQRLVEALPDAPKELRGPAKSKKKKKGRKKQ